MQKIKIHNTNLVTLIDDEDLQYLSKFNWILRAGGYPARTTWNKGHQKIILMHREIMKAEKGQIVDHINRNLLDNRKENLRFCNRSTNAMNCKVHKHNTSGYKGVSYMKKEKKWRAYIVKNNRQESLGCYDCKEEAAIAYNKAATKLFGEFASLNIIPSHLTEFFKNKDRKVRE